ncbi:MAG: hypothetical protein H6Q20_2180 [Bacteroidetes bacterium]|nr:hypothetical protein [Bacteroidota bacterium]
MIDFQLFFVSEVNLFIFSAKVASKLYSFSVYQNFYFQVSQRFSELCRQIKQIRFINIHSHRS